MELLQFFHNEFSELIGDNDIVLIYRKGSNYDDPMISLQFTNDVTIHIIQFEYELTLYYKDPQNPHHRLISHICIADPSFDPVKYVSKVYDMGINATPHPEI